MGIRYGFKNGVSKETGVDLFLWKIKDGMLHSIINSLKGAVEKSEVFVKHQPVIHLANGMLDLCVTPPLLMGFHPDYYLQTFALLVSIRLHNALAS